MTKMFIFYGKSELTSSVFSLIALTLAQFTGLVILRLTRLASGVITKYNGENENDVEVFIMEPDNREVDSDNDDEHFSSIESLNTY